jgi:hypothetical protein
VSAGAVVTEQPVEPTRPTQDLKKLKKRWLQLKDVITIGCSIAAFGVSVTTAYVAHFRHSDNLKLAMRGIPSIDFVRPERGQQPTMASVYFRDVPTFFLNHGTRSVVVTWMTVWAGFHSHGPSQAVCRRKEWTQSHFFSVEFEPTLVKEKEFVMKTVGAKPDPTDDSSQKAKANFWFVFEDPIKEGMIFESCIHVGIITSKRNEMDSYALGARYVVGRNLLDEMELKWLPTADYNEPRSLVDETYTSFW